MQCNVRMRRHCDRDYVPERAYINTTNFEPRTLANKLTLYLYLVILECGTTITGIVFLNELIYEYDEF